MAQASLWSKAFEELSQKDRDVLPQDKKGDPKALLEELDEYISKAKGQGIKLSNGEILFVRDVLQKVSRWVKKFVEVGDTAMQYDPQHAALPWAVLRFILQISLNNLEKHAAIVEAIDKLSFYILWGSIEEMYLELPSASHDRVELEFVQLYRTILMFMARAIKFLSSKSRRIVTAIASADSEFGPDIDALADSRRSIESLTRQIANSLSRDEYEKVSNIESQLTQLKQPLVRVEQIAALLATEFERRKSDEILDWLSRIPFQQHFRITEKKALSGTGTWIFEDPKFIDWLDCSRSQILWLRGTAGTGKSTLVSQVIRHLIAEHEQNQTPFPFYFFCSRNTAELERGNPDHILRCLLRQMCQNSSDKNFCPALQQRFENRISAGPMDAEETTDTMLQMLEARRTTYIIVDALDECDREQRETLIACLRRMLITSSSLLRICVTSRESYSDINVAMGDHPALVADSSSNAADLSLYIEHSVKQAIETRKLLRGSKVTALLQQCIIDALIQGADGMFRWVELHLQYLCEFRVESKLRERLRHLSPGLEKIYCDLYKSNMDRSHDTGEAEIIINILTLLLVAQRPLSTSELCMLACPSDETGLSTTSVLDLSFDLVRLDEAADQFRFSHLSVREFLESHTDEFNSTSAHSRATHCCLQLLHKEAKRTFDGYAAIYWPFHAELTIKAGGESTIEEQLNELLCPPCQTYIHWSSQIFSEMGFVTSRSGLFTVLEPNEIWQQKGFSKEQAMIADTISSCASVYHVVARFGFHSQMTRILKSRRVLDLQNVVNLTGDTPMTLAARFGQTEILQTLLDNGADIDTKGRMKSTRLLGRRIGSLLQVAIENNHLEAAQMLIRRGASLTCAELIAHCDESAFETAVRCCDLDSLELMLNLQAPKSSDYSDRLFRDILAAGILHGQTDAMRLMFEKYLSPAAHNNFLSEELVFAIVQKEPGCLQLLLNQLTKVGMPTDSKREAIAVAMMQWNDGELVLLRNNDRYYHYRIFQMMYNLVYRNHESLGLSLSVQPDPSLIAKMFWTALGYFHSKLETSPVRLALNAVQLANGGINILLSGVYSNVAADESYESQVIRIIRLLSLDEADRQGLADVDLVNAERDIDLILADLKIKEPVWDYGAAAVLCKETLVQLLRSSEFFGPGAKVDSQARQALLESLHAPTLQSPVVRNLMYCLSRGIEV